MIFITIFVVNTTEQIAAVLAVMTFCCFTYNFFILLKLIFFITRQFNHTFVLTAHPHFGTWSINITVYLQFWQYYLLMHLLMMTTSLIEHTKQYETCIH